MRVYSQMHKIERMNQENHTDVKPSRANKIREYTGLAMDTYEKADLTKPIYNNYTSAGDLQEKDLSEDYVLFAEPKNPQDGLPTVYMNKYTGVKKSFYQGKSMEAWCKELPPQKDSLTGCTFYYIGGVTYVPEQEQEKLKQRLEQIAQKKGISTAQAYDRSDMGTVKELSNGVLVHVLKSGGEMLIQFPNGEQKIVRCHIPQNPSRFLNGLYHKIKDMGNISMNRMIQQNFWEKLVNS